MHLVSATPNLNNVRAADRLAHCFQRRHVAAGVIVGKQMRVDVQRRGELRVAEAAAQLVDTDPGCNAQTRVSVPQRMERDLSGNHGFTGQPVRP